MDPATATGPVKKRGHSKKVATEEGPGVEAKKGVRKASTKTDGKGKGDGSVKKTAAAKAAKTPKTTRSVTAKQATPVTPATSKILTEVAKTGTLKAEKTAQVQSTTLSSPSPPKATPPPPSAPPSPTSTTARLSRAPVNPYTRSASALPRPKPMSAEAIEKNRIEQSIREGKMPQKYKPAARKVVAIMVGIPVIVVTGWELYKRWDKTIRTKFDVETVKKPSV
ncbi:hypothetical protein P280DRAFT_467412 [Massarina eburnea CBS 473.64]|uniref:Uncharacterized protein n=1 Tax=Massarina eburnea CBS 473.64 TaxID=1395130 RepID=A0A6A6S6K5_9PLEO|nr:hypothetical protein P280DRAFT_467412 [Massarina eburnea CBS 473.64]